MRKKKKICMIVQNPMVKGGIAAVVNGYQNSNLEQEFNIRYVESYKDGRKFTKLLKAISGYLHFTKVLLFEKTELVHIHSSFGPSFYRKLVFIYMANWFNKPVINHCHGADFDSFYLNASNRKKRLIEKVYSKCTVIIALSDEWKERLSMLVSPEKVVVIENYSTIHEDAIKYKLKKKMTQQILFLGEIGQRKGCYDIPDVVEKVVKEFPNVEFVLAGSGDIDQIKSLLIEKGIEKNVLFTGWVRGSEKDKLLRESDIFFLPSYNEGMPMAILDAMGYGLPIVSTLVGGIPKIVQEGKNGHLCKPGNAQELSSALIKLLMDESACKRYSSSSGEIVKQKYSLEKHIDQLTKLYKKISIRS